MSFVLTQAQLAITPPTHGIMDVPDEILEKILLFLSLDDVASLSLVCKRLSDLVQNSGRIWKYLLWAMYPGTSIIEYPKQNLQNDLNEYDFTSIVKDKDEFSEPSSKKLHESIEKSNQSNVEKTAASNVGETTKFIDLQIQNSKNFWKHQFGNRYSIGLRAKEWLQRLSGQYFEVEELSDIDMEHFLKLKQLGTSHNEGQNYLKDEEKVCREFVLDALLSLIHDGQMDCGLTIKYYAIKIIRYVRNNFAREFWLSFMQGNNEEDQDYYKGLVHFSQWFQPLSRICIASVKYDVERIATSTLRYLHSKCPKHSVFNDEKRSKKDETGTKTCDNKDDSFDKYLFQDSRFPQCEVLLEEKDAYQLLDAINYVMFQEEGFRGNTSNYYNPNNSYIDKVLETRQGIPITLCILYMLIAKRVGVFLEPINFPRHFLLRLKIKDEDIFIDVFQKGKRLTNQEVKQMDDRNTAIYKAARPIEVFQRMVRNMLAIGQMIENVSDSQPYSLLRAALELQKLIGADFEHPGFGLVQLYLQQNVNHREVNAELDNYENWPSHMWIVENQPHLKQQVRNLRKLCIRQLEDNKKQLEEALKLQPKLRSIFSEVHGQSDYFSDMGLFSVGMIMKHKRYQYHCVIYGWDAVCKQSKVWINQMGVDRLRWKEKQPFYNVLVEDGSCRYAASENLMPSKPQRIVGNPQVGKYFAEFDESIGYIANKELTEKYPEDSDIQLKFEGSWRKDRNSLSSNGEIN